MSAQAEIRRLSRQRTPQKRPIRRKLRSIWDRRSIRAFQSKNTQSGAQHTFYPSAVRLTYRAKTAKLRKVYPYRGRRTVYARTAHPRPIRSKRSMKSNLGPVVRAYQINKWTV